MIFAAAALWHILATPSNQYGYNVRSYGARGNGIAIDTASLQAAIDAAARGGGGTVIVPPGRYLSGTLHLRSGVSIRLAAGATLVADRDDADFDRYEALSPGSITAAKATWIVPPRMRRAAFEGERAAIMPTTVDDPDTTYAHYSLIAGDGVRDVTIEGAGAIDGNRSRRGGPKLIAFKNCRHVAVRGITLRNAPNYNISLIGVRAADIDNVTIVNGYADGIDPDNSQFVRITNCYIDTWDDAICTKASLALGRRMATENVVISNCILRTSSNGFKFGTESEGDLRDLALSNCEILRRAHGRAPICGIAIESVDGGSVSGVVISNVVMRGVRTPIFIRLGDRGRGMKARYPGRIGDVTVSDVTAIGAVRPSSIDGLSGFPIRDVTLANIDTREVGGGRQPDFADFAVPELPRAYPQGEMFGALPAYSLYARHVDGLVVSGWRNRWVRPDLRPAAVFDDVSDLQIRGFNSAAAGYEPVILLRNVEHARIEAISTENLQNSDKPLIRADVAGARDIAVASGVEVRHGADGLEIFGGNVHSRERGLRSPSARMMRPIPGAADYERTPRPRLSPDHPRA